MLIPERRRNEEKLGKKNSGSDANRIMKTRHGKDHQSTITVPIALLSIIFLRIRSNKIKGGKA